MRAADSQRERTREIVHVLNGHLVVQLDRQDYRAGPSDTLLFRADLPHAFYNHGRAVVRFIMAVVEPAESKSA